ARRRRIPSQEQVDRVRRKARVPTEPDFRARLADGRPENVQTALAQAMGLFHPSAVEVLQRLDRIGRVVLEALEDRVSAVSAQDALVLNLEVRSGVVSLDLLL